MGNETPLLNLYAVRLSQDGKYAIITFVEGKKPNRTFRKWLVPTIDREGNKVTAIVNGKSCMLPLTISDEFKKQSPENGPKIAKPESNDVDEDDCPF